MFFVRVGDPVSAKKGSGVLRISDAPPKWTHNKVMERDF